MKLYVKRTCMGCAKVYRKWWFQDRVLGIHFCSYRCHKVWFTGWASGMKLREDAVTYKRRGK